MLSQRLKTSISKNKYLLLILVTALIFFYPIFKGEIPFPGDLLVHFYEPYRAYPVLNYQSGAAVPSKNQGTDVVRHIFPWKNFTIESLKQGEIPFWNPHNFSGSPLMANFQSAVFYPLSIVFFVLPFLSAWTLYIFLAPVLACFFMYLFLKELKLTQIASLFGGIVFAFSSYMVVWMEYGNIGHTFLWLPLGLLFTERITRGESFKNNFYLIIVLFMSILAGYIQGFFYLAGVIFFYFLAKSIIGKSLSIKKCILFLGTLIFPVLLSLFQSLPTKELFDVSTRSNYTLAQIKDLLNPWWYSITVIVPNFFGNPAVGNHWFYGTYIERVSYVGIIPFSLFIYALINFKKRKEILIFGVIGILAFIFSLDLLFTKYFFEIPIPTLSTTVPTRMLCIFEFCAAVLAAIGFDFLRQKYNKKSLFISFLFVFFLLVSAWIVAMFGSRLFNIDPTNLSVAKRNLLLPTGLMFSFSILSILWFKKIKFSLILIFALAIFELFYFFDKITPFSPKEFIYPKTPVISFLQQNAGINRFWGYGSGYVESDFQTFDNTFSPEGVDAMHIGRYGELLKASGNGRISEDLPRMDANLAPGYGTADLRQNKYRQRLLDLLGIKYVLNKTESGAVDYGTFPDSTYKYIYHDGSYQIYENKEALPRAFLASGYVVETNDQKILDKIFDTNFDLKRILILEEKISPAVEFTSDDNASLKIKKYGNNDVSILTSTKKDNLLFLSDAYVSGWKANIDGKETKIYRADFAFRAIVVPKGEHVVTFSYIPDSFILGLKISSVAFLVFVIMFFAILFYEKKK